MAIVEIENLTKDYEVGFWKKKKVRALDGLTLNVDGGQIFGFLGGNGAGKTTTIKLLMRLMFATSGTARILGEDISNVEMHRRIGYCPENPYFYDYLTARELMNYFGELFGLDGARRKAKTEELLTKVGLEQPNWDKQLRKFSKGMLQRVGLAQSLINDPEIVFLDEPMSGLDPIGRREVRELIAELREKGTTVFMSTHILSDIEVLCDRVAIMRKGKLAATGTLDELRTSHGEREKFEINISGAEMPKLAEILRNLPESLIKQTPSGGRLEVGAESDIDQAINAVRQAGGKIVSVNAVRNSLEDLFVEKTSAETAAE